MSASSCPAGTGKQSSSAGIEVPTAAVSEGAGGSKLASVDLEVTATTRAAGGLAPADLEVTGSARAAGGLAPANPEEESVTTLAAEGLVVAASFAKNRPSHSCRR